MDLLSSRTSSWLRGLRQTRDGSDSDPAWARQLPGPRRGEGNPLRGVEADLCLDDGRVLNGAIIAPPWKAGLGEPLESLWFQLDHSEI